MIAHLRTPAREDKRLGATLYVVTGLFVLTALRVPISDPVLGGIVALTLGFMGQSQYGQTSRTNKLTATGAPDAASTPPAA